MLRSLSQAVGLGRAARLWFLDAWSPPAPGSQQVRRRLLVRPPPPPPATTAPLLRPQVWADEVRCKAAQVGSYQFTNASLLALLMWFCISDETRMRELPFARCVKPAVDACPDSSGDCHVLSVPDCHVALCQCLEEICTWRDQIEDFGPRRTYYSCMMDREAREIYHHISLKELAAFVAFTADGGTVEQWEALGWDEAAQLVPADDPEAFLTAHGPQWNLLVAGVLEESESASEDTDGESFRSLLGAKMPPVGSEWDLGRGGYRRCRGVFGGCNSLEP